MQVPPTRTPYTHADICEAMQVAYIAQLGHPPTHQTLAVILAQLALETGDGAACVQWNIGNYKRGPGPDWCSFQTREDDRDGTEHVMVCEFSAWPSLSSACGDYLSALYTRRPGAWSAAVAGDPEAFAHALKVTDYYTAPEALYAAGVRRWFTFYLAMLGGDSSPTQPDLDGFGGGVLGVQGLLTSP